MRRGSARRPQLISFNPPNAYNRNREGDAWALVIFVGSR